MRAIGKFGEGINPVFFSDLKLAETDRLLLSTIISPSGTYAITSKCRNPAIDNHSKLKI